MNKLLALLLISSLFLSTNTTSTTLPAVVLAGGIIKAKHVEVIKKYKRKNCPVCKGKGWYISGDDISKVNCGYCEPETKLVEKK